MILDQQAARRAALAGVALGAPLGPNDEHPDAELLELCGRWEVAREAETLFCDGPYARAAADFARCVERGATVESARADSGLDIAEAEAQELGARVMEIERQALALRPRTVAGLKAKGALALAVFYADDSYERQLALAVLQDIGGLS